MTISATPIPSTSSLGTAGLGNLRMAVITLGWGVLPRHERNPQEYPRFCRASSGLWTNRRRTRWRLVPVMAVVLV